MVNHDHNRRAESHRIAESDRTDEELAACLRAQIATVSDFGNDITDRIERATVESAHTATQTGE